MKLLFVCNQNENRGKTAEKVFKDRFETMSAGLFNEKPLSEKELSWADKVLVMEDFQRTEIANRFPKLYMEKQILSLNIPDIFRYEQPELISLLDKKMNELF